MTIASHAMGFPAIGRPRADTIEVAPKPITRQDRARRVMFRGTAVVLGVVLLGTVQQVAAHGWRAFVFRAPGVGGTPARADVIAAPAVSEQAATGAVGLPARHHRGAVHHHPGPPPPPGMAHSAGARSAVWTASRAGSPGRGPASHAGSAGGLPPVIHVPAAGPGPSTPPPPSPTASPTSAATPSPDPVSSTSSGDGPSHDPDGDRPPRPPGPLPPPPGRLPPPTSPDWAT